MFKKEREIPLRLRMEEALLRRLPQNHKKRAEISRNFKKGRAGLKGETELDYHLSFLPDEDFAIFSDLRLPMKNHRFFQIDTLVLTRYFALIIESKNIYGTLFFDSISKQLYRTFDGTKEGFPDPILQAKRQQIQFQKWLAPHLIKPIPVLHLVAIGSPDTMIETTPNNKHIYEKVLHAEHIPDKILELTQTFTTQNLTNYQWKKISQLLVDGHEPQPFEALSYYHIDPSELPKGVPCPSCQTSPLTRIHAKWRCSSCRATTIDAHEQVIHDHLLLCGPLTNPQIKEILCIDSIHTTKRLLAAMNLSWAGKTKGRVYTLPASTSFLAH